ncbi:uncharacterized protein LOC130680522 isoform X2 [Manis pentadactyla]|uniref:uncharacterized protein LOC130680522 isoform X2 n=1 Tax=Manis pentadactyla TaxID=143292 RepID=UPI00255C3075|nr:uncharacterized protein LOC130680522 isoform X2 [Manis pentadactyla]
MLHREGRVGLLRRLSVVVGRGSALRGRGPLAADAAHARPAGRHRPLPVPAMFLSKSAQPDPAEEASRLRPPAGISRPAAAAVARQSPGALQQRPPAASSRRLQGPPSPGTGALFLTQACAPRSGSSRRPGCLPPPPLSNAFFPLTLTFAAFTYAH